jgi:hypothetical protein
MEKVKVVYMDGKETEYDVDYTKAYIAKIIESQNALTLDRKTVREIYAGDKLIAKFNNGFLNELVLEKPKPKKTAGMGRYKGHTVPAGCDVGQYLADEVLELGRNIKDKIKAEDDWNEYQAEILHAEKMIKENIWVTDHTGGDIEITYC